MLACTVGRAEIEFAQQQLVEGEALSHTVVEITFSCAAKKNEGERGENWSGYARALTHSALGKIGLMRSSHAFRLPEVFHVAQINSSEMPRKNLAFSFFLPASSASENNNTLFSWRRRKNVSFSGQMHANGSLRDVERRIVHRAIRRTGKGYGNTP